MQANTIIVHFLILKMFECTQSVKDHRVLEPSYMRKKRNYHQQIRKKDREGIINRLRKNAQLPNDLLRLVQGLPRTLGELMNKIFKNEIAQWEDSIAYIIVHSLRDELKSIFEAKEQGERTILNFFIFLLRKANQEVSLYNEYYDFFVKRSLQWAYPAKIELLNIVILMLKQGHEYVIKDARNLICKNTCNRFYECQLIFYNTLLRKFPSSQNLQTFLSHETLKRLSQQIGIHFYSEQEKIAMMEILIQVLYLTGQNEITQFFDLERIFGNLEYFFGYFNANKMLIDRSIILVYNINIDAGSEKFVKHNCFRVIVCEMRNNDNPTKIRSLMAELYLNSIFNFPNQRFYLFVKSNMVDIFRNLEYIIDEFGHENEIKIMFSTLLKYILDASAHEQQQGEESVLTFLKSQGTLLKLITQNAEVVDILEEYGILQRPEQL